MNEESGVTTAEVFEEASHYSSSQHRAFIEELETDIENLSHSMSNLYDEHAGIFLMYGVQVEVKFSVFNEVAYRQVLGCPELYTKLAEEVTQFMEEQNDQRAQTSD